jgi:hypothetical protein
MLKSCKILKGVVISALHMITAAKIAEVTALARLLPYFANHVWGDQGKCTHNRLAKLRQ